MYISIPKIPCTKYHEYRHSQRNLNMWYIQGYISLKIPTLKLQLCTFKVGLVNIINMLRLFKNHVHLNTPPLSMGIFHLTNTIDNIDACYDNVLIIHNMTSINFKK